MTTAAFQTSFIVPFGFARATPTGGLAPLTEVEGRVSTMMDALRKRPQWQRCGRVRGAYFHSFAEDLLRDLAWMRWTGPERCAVVLAQDKQSNRTLADLDLQVELALHPTGVGMLITTLSHDDIDFADVLLLNERFRILVQAWPGQHLPRNVDIRQEISLFDGTDVDGWQNGWVRHLLGPLLGGTMPFLLDPPPDPRAFVHTWCGLPHPPTDRLWEPFSWVDTAPGNSAWTDAATMADLRRDVDYRRWWRAGTRFGITRYSFASMQQIGPGCFSVREHMATTYRDLVCLQLLRQVRLLTMQRAASHLGRRLSADRPHRAVDEAKRLRAHLLQYATAQDIRQPVHQEQGIDLADRIARQLRLDEAHDKLHRDVERTERWLTEAATDRLSRRVGQLTVVLAGIGVWAGFVGANTPTDSLLSIEGAWPWPFSPGVVPFVLVNAAAAAMVVGTLWAAGRLVDHLRGLD